MGKVIRLTESDLHRIVSRVIEEQMNTQKPVDVQITKIKPEMKVDDTNIIVATSAQVYPNITSWNVSTNLALQTVNKLYSSANLDSKGRIYLGQAV